MMSRGVVCAAIACFALFATVPAAAGPFLISNLTTKSCGETSCIHPGADPVLVPHSASISGGEMVTNSFELRDNSFLIRALIVYWGEMPTNIDWAITTEPFAGTTLLSGKETFHNPPELSSGMFVLYWGLLSYLPEGRYWLQVASPGGLGAWDQCDGPAGALTYNGGHPIPIPSETFNILGMDGEVFTPEPPMLLPFGLGLLVLAVYVAHKMPA